MPLVKQLDSIYTTLENKKILVDIFKWAEIALPKEELDQFKVDSVDIMAFYNNLYAQSEITLEPIVTQVTSENVGTIHLRLGFLYNFPDNFSHHPKYLEWNQKFKSDPNVQYHEHTVIG